MSDMRTNRFGTSGPPRRWLTGSTLASPARTRRLMRAMLERRGAGAAVAGALTVWAALGLFLAACGHKPKVAEERSHAMLVMDDFESGMLTGWKTVGGGAGGWFVYANGSKAPDAARSDPNVPFDVPDPPQGKFAAVSDTNGPGTRILYRDVKLDGRFRLRLSVFYSGVGGFSSPNTLAYDEPGANQQFRIDLVALSAPIDSVAPDDVLVNVFKTSAGDPDRLEPSTVSVDVSRWAGHTVRLRLATTDNSGPLRAGVDDIRFEPIGADAKARIELPETAEPARALNLVLHRMTEADALNALAARAAKLAGEHEFSGAVLVAKDGRVLFAHAYGLADRNRRIPNTLQTRFRIGSMNKMFTAVAILQLVEAGKLKLTAPLGTYLRDYPNHGVVTKVTIHHLLTHTGGTGDIFGPDFDAHRSDLRTLADYIKLYGKRGLEFEPGSQWAYSNYGFILLGAVIEKVTGHSYYDYVRQHIYAPAGMTATGSLPENDAVPGRSIGYTKPPGATGWAPNTDTLPYRGTSAGGGYSTVGDLAHFAHALLSHKLLGPDTTKLLITGKVKTGPEVRYAYGFEDARDANGNGWVGHGGGAPGMNGDLKVYPRSGYVVAVLANLDPPAAQRISDYLDPRLPTQP
jgi:CubicO group peptidase (beta-lactamase class C family)